MLRSFWKLVRLTLSGAVIACAISVLSPAVRAQSATGRSWAKGLPSETRVDTNVVYGMYSGLALLMDVYQPHEPNGYAIVFIPGSGWTAPLNFDAPSIKEQHEQFDAFAEPALAAGYTVFVINHRATPRFQYPEPVEDAQRAVRFVRLWAKRYAVNPDRIGALGYSSGANLATMLGVLSGDPKPDDEDPVNRESGRVQCVVGGGAPTDLTGPYSETTATYLTLYVGTRVHEPAKRGSTEIAKLSNASPFFYVGADDPPMMFFHGTADELVPISDPEKMVRALKRSGVPAKMVRIPGGTHDQPFGDTNAGMVTKQIVGWFDQYLKLHHND